MTSQFGHKLLTAELFLVAMSLSGFIFGRSCWKIFNGVILFIDFINKNQGYLTENNVSYWVSMWQYCADKIRVKLDKLGCKFLPSNVVNGFNVFCCIDNTVFATARPCCGP